MRKSPVLTLLLLTIALCPPEAAFADRVQLRDDLELKDQLGVRPEALRKNPFDDDSKDKKKDFFYRKPGDDKRQNFNSGQFDGSEYGPEDFQDTDFSKETYMDLLIGSKPKAQDDKDKDDKDKDDKDKDDKKKKLDRLTIFGDATGDDYRDESDDRDARARRKDKEEEKYLKKDPPQVKPNDWVPDALDPLDQGGFESSPDNGSPVPYKLNGHVDIQRGRPWLHDHDE